MNPSEKNELSGAEPAIADTVDRLPNQQPSSSIADGLSTAGTASEQSGPRRAAALFIFFTVALDMIALGMIAPVLPRLVETLMHGTTSQASVMLGVFGTVFAGMQFVCSPIIGSLSDRWGRQPVVLLSNLGLGLDYVLMAWAPSIEWLLVGRIVSGLASSSIPTAQAYIADVTPPEKRASAFGLLGGAFAMGFVLGPAVGGLLGTVNPRLPFWVSAGLSLLNALYGLFVLPESLARANRAPFSWRRANPVGSVRMLARSQLVLVLAGILLLAYLAQQALMNVYILYADYRFHWTDRTAGLSLALVGICSGIYGGALVKHAIRFAGERGSMIFGLLLGIAGFSMIGASRTGLLVWFAIPVMNGMSFVWPAAQSMMTRGAAANEQGQMQGAIHSLRGISGLVGPGIFAWIFARAIRPGAAMQVPGSPFFLASALLLLALLATLATRMPRAVRA
ncbi:MFS transporter [Acidipila sp. EB88]|uniref:MFS transporter n=1 Tax=Acidipila sp. EB88 TaxID=2305226 RepID=UPI000F5F999D|nr:MFS transporter [Acidipila sp. EB88]RRA48799.1 MFS transporter [Acidipila sp. EB88]